MALTQLNLKAPVEHRSDDDGWHGLLSPIERQILTGNVPGLWRPGVLASCISRLSGVLSSGDVDPILNGLLPWISRQIVMRGEVVLFLDNDLMLRRVQHYDLEGSDNRQIYHFLAVHGPSRTLEYRNVSPEQVVHCVIRPCPGQPWHGQHWRQVGYVVQQLCAVDLAIQQEGAAPRGSLLPTVSAESPKRLTKLLDGLRALKDGLSTHPLIGRQGESNGPSPQPVRLQTSDMDQLLKAHTELSGDFAEALGIPRALIGYGSTTMTSRPDSLRSWISTTGSGWASTLQAELERVLERDVLLNLVAPLG